MTATEAADEIHTNTFNTLQKEEEITQGYSNY
jgi:hypothetical protein